jgi:hypothetical protein
LTPRAFESATPTDTPARPAAIGARAKEKKNDAMRMFGFAIPAALALLVAGSAHAVTPADKCESGQERARR